MVSDRREFYKVWHHDSVGKHKEQGFGWSRVYSTCVRGGSWDLELSSFSLFEALSLLT